MKHEKIILFTMVFFFLSLTSAQISVDDCTIYGNCQPVVAGTTINNNTFAGNSSIYADIWITAEGNKDDVSDITYDEISGGDVNAAGYTGYFAFLSGTVGGIDMTGDPWWLSGTNLELERNITIDGGSYLNNTYPQNTLTSNLGSGALRWLWLYVANISAENIDTYNLHASENITVDGFINGVNISDINVSNYVPYTGATGLVNLGIQSLTTTGTGTFNILYLKNQGTIWADGTTGSTPTSGVGTRLMWIPTKSSFRAGKALSTEWDDANIGAYSFAVGYGTKASFDYSAAFGSECQATNTAATCFGFNGNASGANSIHFGNAGKAMGTSSIHFGSTGNASGTYSSHFGLGGLADGYATTVFGRYNAPSEEGATTWADGDPLIMIGNGTGTSDRNTAMTIYNNGGILTGGSVGLGASSSSKLTVVGNVLLQNNNDKLYYTTSSSIYYNGSDLLCNPKETGTGKLYVTGNEVITGNLSLPAVNSLMSVGIPLASENYITTGGTGTVSYNGLASDIQYGGTNYYSRGVYTLAYGKQNLASQVEVIGGEFTGIGLAGSFINPANTRTSYIVGGRFIARDYSSAITYTATGTGKYDFRAGEFTIGSFNGNWTGNKSVNLTGVYISAPPANANAFGNNSQFWSIYSAGGNSYHSGNISIGGSAYRVPSQALDIVGNAKIVGNLNQTSGNATINNIYGGMWYHNHTGTELSFASADVYYQLFFTNFTHYNGMGSEGISFGGASNLTIQSSGVYLVNYMAVGDGQNNHKYGTTVFVNETMKDNCESHHKMAAGGDIITQTGTCILRLNQGEKVSVRTADFTGTGTGNYYGGNIDLVRVEN